MGTREPLVLANHHRCVYESGLWVRLIARRKALDSGRGPNEWSGGERKRWTKGSKFRDLLWATSTVTHFQNQGQGVRALARMHTNTHTNQKVGYA